LRIPCHKSQSFARRGLESKMARGTGVTGRTLGAEIVDTKKKPKWATTL